jgi:hypothetical protein
MEDAPPGFDVRAVALEPGVERIYDEAEWRDAIVFVASGVIELECRSGQRHRFESGDILWLAELPLCALHNPGGEAAVLFTVSRTRDDFPVAASSED